MNFSDWFQTSPIPSDAISGKYDLVLVGLSYIVAVFASYVALNLVGRLRTEQNKHSKIYWLAGGAFAMGAGIWSMHFIGMLAFIMPMPMQYAMDWTALSLIMAILASGLALFILQKNNYSIFQRASGGVIIGLAICTMHYFGMEAMKIHISIHYIPWLFFLSIAIGITASEAALYLALQSNDGSSRRQFYLKIISALIMGIAICGMHYTGMEAAVFTTNPTHIIHPNSQSLAPGYLAWFIAGITLLIISITLTASISSKKMTDALENEKNFLKAMLDNLEDGIIACDESGQITVINRTLQNEGVQAKKQLNISDLGNYFTLYTLDNQPLDHEHMPLALALKGDNIQGLELLLHHKNNTIRDVVIYAQRITNSDGLILGAVAVIHDVTELKKTQKLKNEFVSIVSHELRTPLTSIRGSIGLLISGVLGSFSEKADNLLKIANNNCERLLVLINDILDIEKIEAGKMDFELKLADLNSIVDEAVAVNKMYADKFAVDLKVILTTSPVSVYVDSGRLMQVLANLISNACKFSPEHGTVTVTVKEMNANVRVSISDNGPGIPEEFQTRIFQKFSQADSSDTRGKGGTGLGLNISKIIIDKLGGNLGFTSHQSLGSTFYFDLPISQNIHALIQSQSADDINITRRLLVCEDDPAQSGYLKALLEPAGFIVDVAETISKARQLLTQHTYEALLLDLIMPDQDGIAFIRELRAHDNTKDLHIIVVSVIAETGKSVLNGDAVSVIDWMDKPIDLNKILTSIHRIKNKNNLSLPRILHIEDNTDIQQVVGMMLDQYAIVSTANNLHQARDMLEKNCYDLFILDLVLPDGNGIDILPLLAQYHSPVLVFSDMQLNKQHAHYVSQALMKSSSSNETLLNTILHLL